MQVFRTGLIARQRVVAQPVRLFSVTTKCLNKKTENEIENFRKVFKKCLTPFFY